MVRQVGGLEGGGCQKVLPGWNVNAWFGGLGENLLLHSLHSFLVVNNAN